MAILDKERSENLYNADSYKNNTDNWEDEVSFYRAAGFLDALEQAGLIGEIDSILDVGCGSGGVLAEMADDLRLEETHLEGIDISRIAVGIANSLAERKGVRGRIKYQVQSLTDVDTSAKYTVTSMIHVLEHCPDMLEMLEECAKRSEYQYINVPLEYNLFYCLLRNVPAQQYEKYGHLHFFDEPFILKWLDSNGYDVVVKVYSSDYMVQKPGFSYGAFQRLRKFWHRAFGPLSTIRYLAGLSGGYLVKKRT
ncbi:MAG: hypothetical protein DRR42_10495 [Gammaproteobacteria bacterium]|nr:MAG: hypothetical protein DRR42_10495 [Gammaproteobacteria bacterium]